MPEQTHEIWDSRFLRQILRSMADGVFTLDSSGCISSWNPSMERITGYSADEALGETCAVLQCSRCFGKKCPAGLKECGILERGRGEAKECRVRHKDGRDIPVIKNARVVRDEKGAVIGVVETLTDLTELTMARRKAEEAARLLGEKHRFGNIIGKSRAMRQVFTAIRAASESQATILIQGESGTGKELVAGAIHYNSPVRDNPFVTVNCSALSESLLESELFGHVRGAFTGAVRDRTGRFEEADGGTLFLDEIGEISPYIQVKLLRVLQEKEVERVGESRRRKIDIRIIAATHQDLYHRVQAGHFREDLYYRLKVFPIHIPPLRERKDDVPILVHHYIKEQRKKTGKPITGATSEAMRTIMDYPWPGNVRELENAVEHAFVLCRSEEIDILDLPVEVRHSALGAWVGANQGPGRGPSTTKEKLTRERLTALLTACDWNKAEVARQVGLSRTAIWKHMKKWEIPLRKANGT